uniref:Uncharacterized protein n=1 Tax=Nelumbo nucifera TaxID=4432 RepID=A0A822ZYR0_NELNU|nr:TPA_asm: hypothetical protein HUJ06_018196 [Nelumbo nucifera]
MQPITRKQMMSFTPLQTSVFSPSFYYIGMKSNNRPIFESGLLRQCVEGINLSNLSLPKLSFQLEGDLVFSPLARNYFIGFSIIGNLMQQGFFSTWLCPTMSARSLGFVG